jgi:hypothetical protein
VRAQLVRIGSVRIKFIKYMTRERLYYTVAVVRSFKLSRAEQSHFRNDIVSLDSIVYNGRRCFFGMYCIVFLSCVVVVLCRIALYCTTLH